MTLASIATRVRNSIRPRRRLPHAGEGVDWETLVADRAEEQRLMVKHGLTPPGQSTRTVLSVGQAAYKGPTIEDCIGLYATATDRHLSPSGE